MDSIGFRVLSTSGMEFRIIDERMGHTGLDPGPGSYGIQ